jgi:hypothetical protein
MWQQKWEGTFFGSAMGKNQDPGSGKNIPDPQDRKTGKILRKECLVKKNLLTGTVQKVRYQ